MECPKLLRLFILSMCIANRYVYGEEEIEILEITYVYMTTTESPPATTNSTSSTPSPSFTTNDTSTTPSPSTPTDDTSRTTLPPATPGSTILHPFSPSDSTSSTPSPSTPTDEVSNTTSSSTPTGDTGNTTPHSTSTDGTGNTPLPSTPTGDTGNITLPSTPTDGTGNTTLPSTPTGNTGNTTLPSTPTDSTGNTTLPSTPTDGTGNTTLPSTSMADTSNTNTPSFPTTDTSNTTSPSSPTDDTSNTTSPSTHTNVTDSPTGETSSAPPSDSSTPGNEVTSREPQATTPGPVYPEKTYPDIIGNSPGTVLKEIQVEVALLANETGCAPVDWDSEACEELKVSFTQFAEAKYREISGFQSIVVSDLREGSVIVQHHVSYVYNQMSEEDRQLSAGEIYDRAIAPSVDEGASIDGNISFTACGNCKAPEGLVDLCTEYKVDCVGEMEPQCQDNVFTCQSPCARTEDLYCSKEKAVCSQSSPEEEPSCLCRKSEEGWYFGEDCEMYVDRLVLILSVSIGGGLILLLILILSICLCRAKKELKESKQLPFERHNAAFLSGKRDLEMAETRQSAYDNLAYDDLPIDDGWPTTTEAAKRTTDAELEKAVKESAEHRNSKYFWGNVADDLITETPSPNTNPDQLKNGDPKTTQGSVASGHAKSNGPEASDPYNQRYSKVEKSGSKAR